MKGIQRLIDGWRDMIMAGDVDPGERYLLGIIVSIIVSAATAFLVTEIFIKISAR